MPVKASYLLLSAGGIVIAWAGVKGKSVSSVARDVLGGHNPKAAMAANGISGGSAYTSYAAEVSAATGTSGPCSAATIAKNKALGLALAAGYGWSTGAQWSALDSLWDRESGWCNTIANPNGGAYGIAQALPPTKYPVSGQQIGGSSASAQISWGLQYILETYGDPVTAWNHEVSLGWY
jgi:hypothetical protein